MVLAVGLVGTAIATPPNVTITSPPNESTSNNPTPSFGGLAEEAGGEVTLKIYKGPIAEGTVLQELMGPPLLGTWSLGPAAPLEDGTYTAQATQPGLTSEPGTSSPVTFTVNPPPCSASPSIEEQPTSQTVTAPGEASFTAAGSTPANCAAPTVQWYSEAPGASSFSSIGGANSASYTTPATTTGESATKYEAVFTNSFGSQTTSAATLTVNPPPCSASPSIEEQPTSQTVTAPGEASFTAAGSTPVNCAAPTVQWYSEAPGASSFSSIGGANSASYTTPATTTGESATKYEAVFTNSFGSQTTSAATLTVNAAPPTVTSIEPSSGPTAGGTSVTIRGSGFVSPATVKIGSTATSVVIVSEDEITAKTAAAAGSDEVRVSDANGTSTLGPSYTYIPPPTVTLNQPESPSNSTTPSFTGFASDATPVVVRIYLGSSEVSSATATHTGGDWISGNATPGLASGKHTYTAVATQEGSPGNPQGESKPVTFTVDTTSPAVTLSQPVTPSNNTTPSFTGTGSDTTPVIVHIYNALNLEVSTAAGTGSGGSWSSAKASPELSSGEYTAIATQASSLGNPPGESVPVRFTVDTASPTVTLNQPKSPSNNTTPSFTGLASDTKTVTVQIYAGATVKGSPVSQATATGTGGEWSSGEASPELASGEYTATATQTSSLGNPAGESAPVRFTVDTASPTVTLNSPALRSNNTAPSFTGTASDTKTVTVQIYAGTTAKGTVVRTVTATGTGGGWTSSAVSPALPNGEYAATATQESSLGNAPGTSLPVTFTVDTTSPTVTLSQPVTPSNNTTPSFTGAASDTKTVTVQIYAGTTAKGTVVRTVTAAGTGGGWTSSAVSPALPDGEYTATATQESSLGNPAGVSAPVTFTVDTAAPKVTLIQPTSPSNNTTPSFTGTASDTKTVTVQIYAGATATGTIVATATATVTLGSWTSANTSPALLNGQYTAIATQESSLGNLAGVSAPVTFTVNTTSPTVTLQPVALSNNRTPTFTGTASDTTPVTVRVYAGSTATGPVVVEATGTPTISGSWSAVTAPPGLSIGKSTYTAVATEESSLKNAPGVSVPVIFTVDTTAPTVTVSQPAKQSNNSTPSFSGTTSDTTLVTVKVYKGTKVGGSPVSEVTATPSSGSWASGPSALASGKNTYTAVATQKSSLLGNPEGISSTVTFTVDTAAPSVSLNAPALRTNNKTPSFTGTASETTPVTVHIYDASDKEVAKATAPGTGGRWTSGPAGPALSDGRYTAIVEQASSYGNHVGETAAVAFTVDTVPPHVTLTYPANGSSTGSASQLVQGTAGAADGDLPGVTVQLFSGSSIVDGQAPLQSVVVNALAGAWSATFASLGTGSYTVRAEQSDAAGNLGVSNTTTFVVGNPAPAAALVQGPAASFTWFPTAPHTGERISLASSSIDAASPITALAWDLAGTGAFAAGGQTISASFSAPGNHVVRLRATDANGRSSVASETIAVAPPPVELMRPFPVVRIVTTRTASGVKLTLLAVQAPVGARISVSCEGPGCPAKSQSRVAASGKVGAAAVEFRRFERFLRAGVILKIRVSKPGEIGKYTRFTILRGRLSARVDTCLGPAGVKPMVCPSS